MMGIELSADWLTMDALLKYFDKKRSVAFADYINFVKEYINKTIWMICSTKYFR